MHKLILIGFMGSGKSTVGQLLAQKLGLDFMDTDHEILKISGAASVAEIFQKSGEPEFRRLERQIAHKLRTMAEPAVIATGGGMIMDQENQELLKNGSMIIYLQACFDSIRQRVEKEIQEKKLIRPLFADLDQAKKLYDSRISVYESCADMKFDTNQKSPPAIADEIINFINKYE